MSGGRVGGQRIGMTIIASVITIALVWRWRSRTSVILMLIGVADRCP
jgi:hypothetical protein